MTDIRNSPELERAIQILTPREHSVRELRLKLIKRNIDRGKIDAIVSYLIELDYLSDERFAGAYVTERIHKGDGPIKIRANLQKRGVDRTLIERFVSADDDFWVGLAADVLRKRFGEKCDENSGMLFSEWTKRRNFLANRGFPSHVVRVALGGFRRS